MTETPGVYNSRTENSRDDYPTPQWIFGRLNETYQFNIDLAANQDNRLLPVWFGPGSKYAEDALSVNWLEATGWAQIRGFLNPPFRDWEGKPCIGRWLKKAHEETRENGLVVALIPARTDAEWWHEWVVLRASHWHFLRGRIQFDPTKNGTNFGSAVAVYEPPLERDRPGRGRGGYRGRREQ